MVPAGNKAKRLSSVNHTTKTIHHHHHHHHASNEWDDKLNEIKQSTDKVKYTMKHNFLWSPFFHLWTD